MLSEEHERLWPRVIGQDRVKRILLAALRAGRLPHAYLFYGADGVGKDAMALELARVLHCERNGTAACGVCPSCERAANGTHPDISPSEDLVRYPRQIEEDTVMLRNRMLIFSFCLKIL